MGAIKLGQEAEVLSDTYSEKIYKGKIFSISSEAEFTPKHIQTKEERVKLVFAVKIGIEIEKGELKVGMPVEVRIKIK